MEDMVRQECEKEIFRRGELLERFTARKLFRWLDKRYNQEYWRRLEKNQKQWKGKQSGEKRIEMIAEKKKTKKENLKVREWIEDDNEMGNMVDPYYELQEKFLRMRKLKRGLVS